ncbi:hypothetical protein PR048_031019 [Dryococelus australis]|uniref:Uncharacterized protein n=1 Tax=Dryococelus australis TaxID=614101 RepID=A0ABQ9G6X9_9NEOP|nr:hypothetical protein PR048_031019 [Dryococelus australis]
MRYESDAKLSQMSSRGRRQVERFGAKINQRECCKDCCTVSLISPRFYFPVRRVLLSGRQSDCTAVAQDLGQERSEAAKGIAPLQLPSGALGNILLARLAFFERERALKHWFLVCLSLEKGMKDSKEWQGVQATLAFLSETLLLAKRNHVKYFSETGLASIESTEQLSREKCNSMSEEIWTTLSSEVLRADEGDRENPPTNGIVQHDSHMRKSGVTRPGTEPGSPWWEASRLTAQPQWPRVQLSDGSMAAKFSYVLTVCARIMKVVSELRNPDWLRQRRERHQQPMKNPLLQKQNHHGAHMDFITVIQKALNFKLPGLGTKPLLSSSRQERRGTSYGFQDKSSHWILYFPRAEGPRSEPAENLEIAAKDRVLTVLAENPQFPTQPSGVPNHSMQAPTQDNETALHDTEAQSKQHLPLLDDYVTPTKCPASGGKFPEETVDKPTIMAEFSGAIENTKAKTSSISQEEISYDSIYGNEEECYHSHIPQEDNILCNEKVSRDIPKNNAAPRTGTPNENVVNDSDSNEAITENEETSHNGEVVEGIKKRKVQRGEENTTVTGNVKSAKCVREGCGLQCKFQLKNIHDKTHISDEFYALDVNRKSDFVSKLMDVVHPTYSYKKEGHLRSPNVACHFIVNGHRIRVCKNSVMKTLVIRATFLTTVKKNKRYPKKPELYVDECQTEPFKSVALKPKYKSAFNTEFNIAFYHPKKDLLSLCTLYENSSQEEKIQLQQKYVDHRKKKKTFQGKLRRMTLQQNLDIQCITQKYLIIGHTQNEGDAMQSLIERKKKQALKSCALFVPSQIATIAQVAKTTGKPYIGEQVDNTAILGWKSFYSPNYKNMNVSAQKKKGDLEPRRRDGDITSSIPSRGRHSKNSPLPAYSEPPKITAAKKKDLLQFAAICKSQNRITSSMSNYRLPLVKLQILTVIQTSDYVNSSQEILTSDKPLGNALCFIVPKENIIQNCISRLWKNLINQRWRVDSALKHFDGKFLQCDWKLLPSVGRRSLWAAGGVVRPLDSKELRVRWLCNLA